jgi:hypothetical protein
MDIHVPHFDMRRDQSGGKAIQDRDTGETIGGITYSHGGGDQRRHVTIFDRYRGSFATPEECVAFAKGVESVLNHILPPTMIPRTEAKED